MARVMSGLKLTANYWHRVEIFYGDDGQGSCSPPYTFKENTHLIPFPFPHIIL